MTRFHPGLAIMACCLPLCAGGLRAEPASHEAFPGTDVLAHYVKLKGHGLDNDRQLASLMDEYAACAKANELAGKPVQPPPKLPEERLPVEHEIYYSANRTLSVKRGVLYVIDRDTCALATRKHHIHVLRSSAGKCDIDLVRNEARGECDSAAHARAPASRTAAAKVPAVDMEKVPPHLRARVEEQLKQMKAAQPAGSGAAGQAQRAGSKTVAGHQCTVYRLESVQAEKCVAHPPSPFVIPAAPYNEGLPGILLQVRQPAVIALDAERVTLNLKVSEQLFSVPRGARIFSAGGSKR